jgi:transposase
MVGQLIQQRFGLKMSKASVCRLLSQLGLSPQRPVWRAYQPRPEEVQRWLQQEYPQIRRLAQKHKALIFFGDEAGVRSDHHAGTTWAVKGKTPVVSSTGARFGLNLMSAVSAQGEFRFMTIKGRVGAAQFIAFIKRLIHNVPRMVFLIVDGHPAHKAKMVKQYCESVKDRFRLFFLPAYSPELNPDERVWNDLKNNAIGRQAITTPQHLKKSSDQSFAVYSKITLSSSGILPKRNHQIRSLNVQSIMRRLIISPVGPRRIKSRKLVIVGSKPPYRRFASYSASDDRGAVAVSRCALEADKLLTGCRCPKEDDRLQV